MRAVRLIVPCLAALAVAACESPSTSAPDVAPDALLHRSGGAAGSALLDGINTDLASAGRSVRVAYMEYVTDAASGQLGRTVYANDRGNKQLGHDFVPGDPERGGRTDITWATDLVDGATSSALTASQTAAAIRQAMGTWQDATCSELPLVDLGDFDFSGGGFDLGVVQSILGFGGVGGWLADITHAGWLPGDFFDLLAEDGSDFILGATITFIWFDDAGNPTDIDGNGKGDVAFREIYYNDAFDWHVDGRHIDVESVALHEAGHGLSQAHFGAIFETDANGRIHFAPRAVMNAAYSGVQHDLTGTDQAGHCSNWGSWPLE